MDFDSRNSYRERVSQIARRSDLTEVEVAKEALALARKAQKGAYEDSRSRSASPTSATISSAKERGHSASEWGTTPRLSERFRSYLRAHPDEYLSSRHRTAHLCDRDRCVLWILMPVTRRFKPCLLSMLIVLLPGSQAAVQLMNYFTTKLLPADPLA